MILCNVLFALVSLVLIVLGAYTQIKAKSYLDFLGNDYVNTPIFIIILGGAILVISCLGFCGAKQESKCLIYTYAIVLFILVIAQVGAAIAAFVLKGKVEEVVTKNMAEGMQNYGKDDFGGVTTTWDLLQHEYKCCGVTNSTNWTEKNDQFQPGQVPDSCCDPEIVENCGKSPDSKFWTAGCFEKFKDDFVGNIGIVAGVGAGIAVCEIIAALFSCYLAKRVMDGHSV